MKITVTVSNELGPLWATPEQFAELSDQEIVELIQEDVTLFLDGASWTVDRGEK